MVVEVEAPAESARGPRLTPNQATFLGVLQEAARPLSWDEWMEKGKEAGLDTKRRAWAWDLRHELRKKGLVYEGSNGWSPK